MISASEKAGHGSTLDTAALDEAWAHPDFRLEQACRPAMVTRRSAQLYVIAQPEPRHARRSCGRRCRQDARPSRPASRGMAYLEYSAPDGDDPGDPETWRKAIPALGTTITEETIRATSRGCSDTILSARS